MKPNETLMKSIQKISQTMNQPEIEAFLKEDCRQQRNKKPRDERSTLLSKVAGTV